MTSGYDIHLRERASGWELVVFRFLPGGGTPANPDWVLIDHERVRRTYDMPQDALLSARNLLMDLQGK